MTFSKPPTHSGELKVSFPAEHVLLLALNRPKMLNAMSPQLEADLNLVLAWFDDEPELWYLLRHLSVVAIPLTRLSDEGPLLSPVKEGSSAPVLTSLRESPALLARMSAPTSSPAAGTMTTGPGPGTNNLPSLIPRTASARSPVATIQRRRGPANRSSQPSTVARTAADSSLRWDVT
jgi:hypothetical protein